MTRRRVLIFVLLALLGVVIVGALTPTQEPFEADRPTDAALAAENVSGTTVEASLPRDRPVRARVGDVVNLTVRANAWDLVEVTGLALEAPVDATEPAQIVFVAERAGEFPVRLRYAGEVVGTLRLDG